MIYSIFAARNPEIFSEKGVKAANKKQAENKTAFCRNKTPKKIINMINNKVSCSILRLWFVLRMLSRALIEHLKELLHIRRTALQKLLCPK